MRETWYVLDDGTFADPADVIPDKNGKLHKDGVAVAMRGAVPSTSGVDPDEERAKLKTETETELDPQKEQKSEPKEMKPAAHKHGYKTK